MSKTLAKKAFAVASSSALVLASFASLAVAAPHQAGSNVLSNGTVYFVSPEGTLRGYTSEGAFLSYGVNSWSKVVPATAEDLALPRGTNYIPPMDGSLINDNGTIWVMSNGQRAGITTMAVFNGLGYKLSNVLVGDTSFMSMAAVLNSASQQHPVGALVNLNGTIFLMTPSGRMGIPSESVFNSWGYSFAKVVPANAADAAVAFNSGIMPAFTMGRLSPYDGVSGTQPLPSTGNVSVSVASSNPASTTLVVNQSQANLGEFTFYGNGVVTNVNLKRVGVSADTTLANVFLFDGAQRITDASSVSSGSVVNFSASNGLFTVNGSKTITVKADLAGTAGETVGVQLVSAMTGSTAVSGTPVSGNINTIAGATLAGVSIASATGSGNTDPGTDINVWQGSLTVGTRDVLMTRLALRQVGSILNSDIKNFKLFADGVQVATSASLDANGYVTFSMSKALTTGTRVLKVTADIIGGSGRTVQLSLRGAYDITVTDTQYNANPAVSGTFPFGPASFTVNSGTLTTVKAVDSQSLNVTVGGSDVSVGKWTMTAYGEPVKVETLTVGVDTNGTDADVTFRNVRVLVNGSQVGSTTSVAAVNTYATGTSYTTNFTVNPGTPATVEVRADMFDNEATNDIAALTTTSAQFALVAGSANGRPQVSLGTINVPTSSVAANTLTISSGTVSVAQTSNYGAQTVVVPQTAYKIGSFVVTGNSTEAVNLNTIYVGFTAGSTVTEATDLSDLYVKYGSNQTSVKGSVSSTILNGNSWSVNIPLAVNETMQFDVYATLASSVSTNAIITTLAVAGITAQSGTTVYADSVANTSLDAGFTGQTITGGTGSITATLDASSPVSKIVDDSGTVDSAAFKFAAVNDAYTITDATVTITNASAIQTVSLVDNGVVVASKPGATSVTFSGMNIAAGANANKVLTVRLTMSPVGVGAGTTGSALLTTLTAATARNSNGTSAAVTESDPAGNAMYVYKAIPTVSNLTLPSSLLGTGTQTIAKVSISSGGSGTVGWKKVIFTVNKTGRVTTGPDLAGGTVWDADSNTQIAGVATHATTAAADAAGTISFVATNEQEISGAKNYELRATVTGTLATGDNVNVNIAQPSSYVAPAAYATVAATAASFVWSDQAAASHDATTLDWNNGFLVKNLPTNSQTLTK